MSTATLNIKVSPRRMLSIREAADYCALPIKRFHVLCSVSPILMPTGKNLYDIQDLDRWLDGLKIGQPNGDDDIIGRLQE